MMSEVLCDDRERLEISLRGSVLNCLIARRHPDGGERDGAGQHHVVDAPAEVTRASSITRKVPMSRARQSDPLI
jgi:hypothetical protein